MSYEKGYVTFNYSDIIFSYYFDDDCLCAKMVRDHCLVYVHSGEYLLKEGDRTVTVGPGQCVFIRRDNRINMVKKPGKEEPFRGIFMLLKRNFLREVYQRFEKRELPSDIRKPSQSVILLPETPEIKGLFLSMIPYFDSAVQPSEEIMQLKLLEGVYALLHTDQSFFPTLFDFTEPWKIDILDFLNENYMYDLTLEEIASFTGRSLSTFKRDFKKVSDLSPEKWLIRRRLEAAREMLHQTDKSVSDVSAEVGFKNLSHFSAAFKRQFGKSPRSSGQ
ncbi:MAG TPA: AraC family transcriptional regulator [Candidatus Alistipes avicola]|uniref:AraC family transcriptional regulator n=1 Tax=Candidatus Alistipes avicola TaxID=2838432 RepID=A0A9D2RJ17_9BACT|nr:AraC family transcriptional regulator [uncultured Alistipes sp.]HJA99078.1 AraC family transcriptional regulator [Candidatus Alistipes avicola]